MHEVLRSWHAGPAILLFIDRLECIAGPHDIHCEACIDWTHALAVLASSASVILSISLALRP